MDGSVTQEEEVTEPRATAFWVADWFVDPASNRIERKCKSYRLEMRTMGILVKLAEHPGATVSKDEIIAAAWSTHVVSDHSVATAISDLRRALNDNPRNAQIIETVSKRGYRLVAPVSPVDQMADVRLLGKQSSTSNERNVALASSIKQPIVAFSVIGIAIFFLAIHGLTDSIFPTPPGPIVVGDICVGNVNAATEDLAYGFGELLTVALTQDPNRPVVRLADENEFDSRRDGSGATEFRNNTPPILVDSSIVQTADVSLIVLEISNGQTQELIWGGKFPVTTDTLESTAKEAADDILSALSPVRIAGIPK